METPEEIAKRRSKNRVNARRSRERKRVMLDTLQQDHWQLHQENKQIKLENDELRGVIQTIKKMQRGDTDMPTAAVSGNGNLSTPINPPKKPPTSDPTTSSTSFTYTQSTAGDAKPSSSSVQSDAFSLQGNTILEALVQQALAQRASSQQNQESSQVQQSPLEQLGTLYAAAAGTNQILAHLLLAKAATVPSSSSAFSQPVQSSATPLIDSTLATMLLLQQQMTNQGLPTHDIGAVRPPPTSWGAPTGQPSLPVEHQSHTEALIGPPTYLHGDRKGETVAPMSHQKSTGTTMGYDDTARGNGLETLLEAIGTQN